MKIVDTAVKNKLYDVTDDNGVPIPHLVGKVHKSYKQMRSEVDRLYRIQHLEGVSQIVATKDNIIFLERIEGDDLFNILIKKDYIPEKEIRYIAGCLILIVKSLHDIGIVHCDIKPENIMYNEIKKQVTLIDFEYGQRTPNYSAPEVLLHNRNSYESDIWSIGVTIYTLCMGHNPYNDINHMASGIPMHEISTKMSYNEVDFMNSTMVFDYRDRMTIDECMSHGWFTFEELEIEEKKEGYFCCQIS